MYFIIESIFFGFPVFIIIGSLFYFSNNEKVKMSYAQFKDAAFITLSLAAIAYTMILILQVTLPNHGHDFEFTWLDFLNRATGPYWYFYLITLLTYTLLPQLFWIKKIRDSRAYTVLLTFLMVTILNFDKIVILMTQFHRDFVPSSWSVYSVKSIPIWLFKLGVFLTISSMVFFARKRHHARLN